MRLISLLLFASIGAHAQNHQETLSFSDALRPHLKKYNIQSDRAYQSGDLEKGQAMFDSIVHNYLIGSRLQPYNLKNISGGNVKLSKVKKPVFLITYASWCVLHKGEIAALNKLSRQYKDVEFVVLFWDKKEKVRRAGRKFRGRVKVCYANEAYRNDVKIVSTLKHTLGFPMSYYLTDNLEVVDIKRGGASIPHGSSFKEVFATHYELFDQRLADFLLKKDMIRPQLATVPD